MDFSEKGVYCLVFENRDCVIEVGKKGTFSFPEGFHIYTGSALGSGGMKRVKRHIDFSLRKDRNPRWHVDYLHLNPSFKLSWAVCASTPDRLECELARRLGGDSAPGFGCTDCACSSHLFYRKKNPLSEIKDVFGALGLRAVVLER
ncbi:endonuclease III [Methanosarcina sp. 2.H.T.1A.6]|uniref:GIY-YIG nuclease family protein n=1 Tax=unclassified Methanosarcina TaxID=2644672 RepID=UPI000621772A|nr:MULTISPECIES: GIY-YIG nuclease family protein [unclassified Methanosarcina]KKG13459.1 endonuclease III [Methanosarcina sp. 2.H.T.1A.3]KKG23513.1 endonuclease III [Methanosarcina sp. 2.H.T.1A.6]KKG24678.1 endonuclease III [Methanosarcina sp. 2.H.T.1A.15]KKG24700.1 endonuclease III [Methanosarcina sp. 2.H.T.1A.8]